MVKTEGIEDLSKFVCGYFVSCLFYYLKETKIFTHRITHISLKRSINHLSLKINVTLIIHTFLRIYKRRYL